MDLQNIFDSITPDNIKNIPVVKYCMQAFIKQLKNDAQIAEKISRIYDIDSTEYFYFDSNGNKITHSDSRIVRVSKEHLKIGLVQFYINVLYKMIEEAAINPDVKVALSTRGYDAVIFRSIENILTCEHLGGLRYFQQSTGNKDSINYMYEFSMYLERGYAVNDLKLTEYPPLHLEYSGSLHESMFTNFMKKMVHPAGWTTSVETISNLADFYDYFGIKMNVVLNYIMLDNPANTSTTVWCFRHPDEIKELLKGKENHHTGENYTDDDIERLRFIYIDEQPVIDSFVRGETLCKQYTLSNGMTLYYNGCVYYLPTEIYNEINWLSQADIDSHYIAYKTTETPVNKYLGNVLLTDIEINDWHFIYYDDFDLQFEMELHNTDDNYYFVECDSNALNINGSEYQFIPGYDESYNKITNYNAVKNNFDDTFKISFDYDLYYLTLFKIYDDYGHGYLYTLNDVNRERKTFSCSSLIFEGENLYIEFIDMENGKTYIYLNNLNRPGNNVISNVDYSVKDRLTVSGYVNSPSVLKLSGSRTLTKNVSGSFTATFNVSRFSENEDYTLSLGDLMIKSNLIQQESNRPNITFPFYENNINTVINARAINKKSKQPGISSGNGDTFYNYTLDNPDEYNNAFNTIIEGNPKRFSYKNSDTCTFINKGYRKVPSESTDCYIPACTKYSEDDFYIENYNSKGNYLTFENDEFTEDLNVYQPIGRYLYFRDSETYDNYFTEGYIINRHSFTDKNFTIPTNANALKSYEISPLEKSYYLSFNLSTD